jgi:hypothetical protein
MCATTDDVRVMFSQLGVNNKQRKNIFERRLCLDIPYYHGILRSYEIKRLLQKWSYTRSGYFLIEHAYVYDSLHLYIAHIMKDFENCQFTKVNARYVRHNNTWEGLENGIRTWGSFKSLYSLIQFYLMMHSMDLRCGLQCECQYNRKSRQIFYKPKSLFDSSAFVVRNFFYYDRNFVESKLPKTLFHRVFAGATV